MLFVVSLCKSFREEQRDMSKADESGSSSTVDTIRRQLLDRSLVVACLLAVPALAGSLLRAVDTGWQAAMSGHAFAFLTLLLATVFRRRLGYNALCVCVSLILFTVAVSTYISFGLTLGPYVTITAVVLITLLAGKRAGLAALGVALLLLACCYFAVSTGLLKYTINFNAYLVSRNAWFHIFISLILYAGGIVFFVSGLYQELTEAQKAEKARAEEKSAIAEELEKKSAEQAALLAGYAAAEARVADSEDRFRIIAENTSDFIWIVDLEGNFLYVGGACEAFTGCSCDELKGVCLVSDTPPPMIDGMRGVIAEIRESIVSGSPILDGETTYQFTTSDGGMGWHEAKYHLRKGVDDQTLIVGISRDITQRKLIEREVSENARLLGGLDRINRTMTRSTDLSETLNLVLKETLEILGCDRAYMIFPCDPEASEWTATMERTRPEFPGISKDGSSIPILPWFAGVMGKLLATTQPVQTLISETDGQQREFDIRWSVKSRLMVAVRPRIGKPWLFGVHQCSHEREWSHGDRELMRQIGARFSDGLSTLLILRELAESEGRLRAIVATIADWVWECDRHGRFTYASEQVTAILGFTPEEVVGQMYTDMMLPGEVERVSKVVSDAAKRRVSIRNIENWCVRKDGRPVCILTNGIPKFDSEGRFAGYTGVDMDITERKLNEQALQNSERRFKDLFQSASIGIILANARSQIIDANPEALRSLGYTLGEIRKVGCESLLDPNDPVKKQLLNFYTASDEEATRQDRRFLRRNGVSIPVLVSISSSMEGIFIIMFQDMTSHQQIEEQLYQAQKLEAVATLASGIAHDFNNILQAIMGFSQLLSGERALSEKARSYVERIEGSAERGASLVKNMLDFSRSAHGDMIPVDLGPEIAELVDFLSRTMPMNVQISASLLEKTPKVEADRAQIEQVLLNLATNAKDAMADGGVLTIRVSSWAIGEGSSRHWPEAPKGRYLEVSVGDTGNGISPEAQSHIFEPFFTTKVVGQGTGLGLSTAYGIIRNHRGFLRCESEPGKTVFSFILPVVDEELHPEFDEQELSNESSEAQPSGIVTVLVVDDEDYVREIASEFLAADGYNVLAAASGEEALELLDRHAGEIAAVLLDIGMPGIGGEECLSLMLEKRPNLRVIMASGYGFSMKIEQLLAAGAKAFITKPYRIKTLSDKICEVIGKPEGLPLID